jgi:uncharacterized membrane protein
MLRCVLEKVFISLKGDLQWRRERLMTSLPSDLILEFLRKNMGDAFSVREIRMETGLAYTTVVLALSELERRGQISSFLKDGEIRYTYRRG